MPDRPMGEIYISEIVKESDLTHYGVKGMHWGIRKDPGSDSGSRGGSKNSVIKSMPDADLQKVITRMRLEQQYRDLTTNPAVKTGKKQVGRYLNQTLNLVITTALTATVGSYMKNGFDTGNWAVPHPTDLNQIPGFRSRWV